MLFFAFATIIHAEETRSPSMFPEQDEINHILSGSMPEGVLFLVMEHDEEALLWVLPRVIHYTGQLREKWSELSVVLLSHGDEMFALMSESGTLYPEIVEMAEKLVTQHKVLFNVCGAFASQEGVSGSEFQNFVDVVPFAPAEIENYRNLEFKVINIEQTW